ncbi:glycosyltransferase family 4 protein [Amycolatopsis tolypomycina]|uniref:Glycosyl transferases group 1 n=1 Tax=Amycolatopsis tolypomycina TaxID=208445 RepID=A0A1H5CMP8_9PSEU|nr:glycosyltransferase family 4 protein [Amycolatopsis tolypomycina]SED68049.1 Glycosyl transferases group 1 [Amycolatopsis tolypomycina]
MNSLYVILPGDVDDTSVPSGGNTYDRRMCDRLAEAGFDVHEIAVSGSWPRPDTEARAVLGHLLSALPTGSAVLLDGLVACGVPEVVVPQARRLSVSVLVHLPLADETGLPPALAAELDALERETLQAVGSVVATSEWAARRLIDHHGLAPHRVHSVTPGVDPAPLAVGTDGMSRLVCVANVTPRKGQGVLAQALETVADLRWTCECVGGIRRETKYVERLREHRLGDRFKLTGPRTGRALEATYHTADLLVLPSRAETFGMVVTEALARGVPVLTTDVDALPDTVGVAPDGSVPGMLVPGDDVEALGAALRRWLTEPALRSRLRASAKLRRETLTGWDDTARRIADILLRQEAAA